MHSFERLVKSAKSKDELIRAISEMADTSKALLLITTVNPEGDGTNLDMASFGDMTEAESIWTLEIFKKWILSDEDEEEL